MPYITSLGTLSLDDSLGYEIEERGVSLPLTSRGAISTDIGGHYSVDREGLGALAPSQAPGAAARPIDWQKVLLVIALVLIIALVIYTVQQKGGVKANPPKSPKDARGMPKKGVSSLCKLYGSSSGTWWYRRLKKGSRRKGPFASCSDAREHAQQMGYAVVEPNKDDDCP